MGVTKRRVIAVIGSTGVGKSQLAVDLALKYGCGGGGGGGEVVNVDALQLYDSLPISCNKVTGAEMQGVRHHLMDYLPTRVHLKTDAQGKDYTVTDFSRAAQELIGGMPTAIVPVLAGGTHYYMQSVLFADAELEQELRTEKRMADPPNADELKKMLQDGGTVDIRQALERIDPVQSRKLHPNDDRKNRRALEVYLETGRRHSDILDGQLQRFEERYDSLILWLHSDKHVLDALLDKRIVGMLERGLLREALEMHTGIMRQYPGRESEVDSSRGVLQSIGYKELQPYLLAHHADICICPVTGTDLNALKDKHRHKLWLSCVERMQISTRQLAKSQLKWIRNKILPVCHQLGKQVYVVDVGDGDWQAVQHKAFALADQWFTDASQMPLETSPLAQQRPPATEEQLAGKSYCDDCECHIYFQQWPAHVESNRHRKTLQRKNRVPYVKPVEQNSE